MNPAPSKPRPSGEPLRWVSWAAVSSQPQAAADKVSIPEQLRLNAEHVAKHGGAVVAELVIPGESRDIDTWEEACARIDAYAALVVKVGANVQPGQEVLVQADVAHAPIARAVAEQAYIAGAYRVRVEYADPYVRRSALRHAPTSALTSASKWELDRIDEWTAHGLLVTYRANGLVPMYCGETVAYGIRTLTNLDALVDCARRAKTAAREYEHQERMK
jgi:hypothetical protein